MNYPTVTVILSTYNREKFIAESLESIFAQTIPPSQVIVINDGSTDHTKDALRPFLDRIDYLEIPNGGKATALNLAMERVTGKYVWIMDDDDVALPDALERHLAILENSSEYGWTYGSYIMSTTDPVTGRILPKNENPLPQFLDDECYIRLMEECFLVHPTVVVRTACYPELGPFDVSLVRCQDYEMALRIAHRFRGARVKGPVLYRRYHSGTRGTAANQFDSQQVLQKWLEYMKPIFRRIRTDLPLSNYLPDSLLKSGDPAPHLRRAYLQRAVIMGKKLLFAEMLEDLQSALAVPAQPASLTSPEREMLQRLASYTSGDPLLAQKGLLSGMRQICHGAVGEEIRQELDRVLFWRLNTAWHLHEPKEALQLASAILRISGMRVGMSIILHRALGDHSSPRPPYNPGNSL